MEQAIELGPQRTAKEVYNMVLAKLQSLSEWRLAKIKRQLHSMELQEGCGPGPFLKRMLSMIDEASMAGIQSAINYPARIIIAFLPQSYETTVRASRLTGVFPCSQSLIVW